MATGCFFHKVAESRKMQRRGGEGSLMEEVQLSFQPDRRGTASTPRTSPTREVSSNPSPTEKLIEEKRQFTVP
jgi:hypothetical protein